jgi:hypothetical protein
MEAGVRLAYGPRGALRKRERPFRVDVLARRRDLADLSPLPGWLNGKGRPEPPFGSFAREPGDQNLRFTPPVSALLVSEL